MERVSIGSLLTFVLASIWAIGLIGCAPAPETPKYPELPLPEEQPAPTPEPPRVFPAPSGFVNDFAEVIDDATERDLETKLSTFQQENNVDFAVVTVLSTGPESVDDYSLEMAREWKIGSEKGGLLLLVSIDDRKWRIQIDRKLEALMTNAEVRAIGEVMVPAFKRKNYSAGIVRCTDSMLAALKKKFSNS